MHIDTDKLKDLVHCFNVNGPRYTSYPTANLFEPGDYETAFQSSWQGNSEQPVSIYVHVPFCDTVCYYCACNRIHTANHAHADAYVESLLREIDLIHARLGTRKVAQLHFGGGTPTFLSSEQMSRVMNALERNFDLSRAGDRDFSIEIDPRKVDRDRISLLANLGLNRMSIGIQDFDPKVQAAVNRLQSEEETACAVQWARCAGFASISVDLIYGLPLQSVSGFQRTLQRTIQLNPDRLSVYSYAHLPERFKTQRQIRTEDLPDPDLKLELMLTAVRELQAAGYEYLGMDHFARPDDSLYKAFSNGQLQRNFMGYSTHANCDLIGLGVSAIGQTDDLYWQNEKELTAYHERVAQGQLPIERGYELTKDDRIRRWVIQSLMCQMHVHKGVFAEKFNMSFTSYFTCAQEGIKNMINHGLLSEDVDSIHVTQMGRFFIRNICMLFDAHLPVQTTGFSKTI